MRTFGLNRESGEIESVFVIIQLYRDDKLASMEYFDLEHMDQALASFDVLTDGNVEELGTEFSEDRGPSAQGATSSQQRLP